LPCRFVDALRAEGDGQRLERELLPEERDVVRSVEPDAEVARMLSWSTERERWFELDGRRERLVAEVSLLGQRTLSSSRGASLPYDVSPEGFLAFDPQGDPRSVVHLLRAALPRVPFDAGASMRFSDIVPSRWLLGRALHALFDFVAPFARGVGAEMSYQLAREPGRVVVTGRSRRVDRLGAPRIRTRAVLDAAGIASLEVRRGARVRRALRAASPEANVTHAERSRRQWIGEGA
jgi:hypothetical protein